MYNPEAYHLIEFNCNHFTADVVGFLTGGTIPDWISGKLYHPKDVLTQADSHRPAS